MAVIEALAARRDFTKTDEALAEYILAHADDVVRMRASELARNTYTSTAAINRLVRKVGSDNFRAFLVDLHTELERRRMESDVKADLRVETGQSVINTMSDVGSVFRKAIDATMATVDPLALHNAARTILRSDRVVLYGAGDSAVACEQLANDLLQIGIPSVSSYRFSLHWSATRMVGRGDVALFVSYSGNAIRELLDHVRAIHEGGGKNILITSRDLGTEINRYADHVLALPTGEDIVSSTGTFFSQMCIRYVLSCLYATAYSFDAEGSERHRSSVVSPDWRARPL